jgi:hypothetical protein
VKKLFLFFFILHFASYGQQADGLEICFEVQKSLKGFAEDKEADDALDEILAVIGAAKNFSLVPCDDINNALALTYKGERYILYDKDFIDKINKSTNNWSGKFILAHEVGHHINGHTRDFLIASVLDDQTKERQREEELEADKFAGFIVAKLGASYNQIIGLIDFLASERDDRHSTHPNKNKRLVAIKKGFDNANSSPIIEKSKKNKKSQIKPKSVDFKKSKLITSEKSKWDLSMPYNINLAFLNKTGLIFSEILLYLILIVIIILYSFLKFKGKNQINKSIAFEVSFAFSLLIISFCLKGLSNNYNNDQLNRFSKTKLESEKYLSKLVNPINDSDFAQWFNGISSGLKPFSFNIDINKNNEIVFNEGKLKSNLIYHNPQINKWHLIKKIPIEIYPLERTGVRHYDKSKWGKFFPLFFEENPYTWIIIKPNNNINIDFKYRFFKSSNGESVIPLSKNRIRDELFNYAQELNSMNDISNNSKIYLYKLRARILNSDQGVKKYWNKYKIEYRELYKWGKPLPFFIFKSLMINLIFYGYLIRLFVFVFLWTLKTLSAKP